MQLPRRSPSAAELLLGAVYALIGGGGLAGGLFMLGVHPDAVERVLRIPAVQVWAVFILVGTSLLGPSLFAGLALLRGRQEGRGLVIIVSILMLFLVPIGTALGLWGLILLRSKRPKATGTIDRDGADTFRARQVAYEAAPQATCTCRHLAPIERASRLAGLRLAQIGARDALILDPVFRPSLERLIESGSPVRCIEVLAPERSPHDPPRPMLHCRQCHSSLLFEDAAAPQSAGR